MLEGELQAIEDHFLEQEAEWFANNDTFQCSKLSARITVKQCEENRRAAASRDVPGMLWHCLRCERPSTEEMMGAFCKFDECTRRQVKKGLCSTHFRLEYGYSATAKTPPPAPASPRSEPVADPERPVEAPFVKEHAQPLRGKLLELLGTAPQDPPGFYLDFTGHTDLLFRLEELCEDVNAEVIEMLNLLIQGKLRRVA